MYGYETWATAGYLCSWTDAFDAWALCRILRFHYTHHITRSQKSGQCQGDPAFQHGNGTTLGILWLHIARSAPDDDDHHYAVAAAIRKPPSDWKRGIPNLPITRGSEPLNRIWDHWTSVLPTRGRRQPLENTGVRLWTLKKSMSWSDWQKEETELYYDWLMTQGSCAETNIHGWSPQMQLGAKLQEKVSAVKYIFTDRSGHESEGAHPHHTLY